MAEKIRVFSKVQIEVAPPMKVKDKDVKKDSEGKLIKVIPDWNIKKGQAKKSVEFKKNQETLLTEEQFNWPTVQQLLAAEKILVVDKKKTDPKQFGTDAEVKAKLIEKCKELGIQHEDDVSVDALRALINEFLEKEKAELVAKAEELGIKVRSNASSEGLKKAIAKKEAELAGK